MNKDHHVFVELVIIIALVAFGFWSLKKSSNLVSTDNTVNNQEVTLPKDISKANINVNVPPSISYAQALVQFKDARLQLDQNCQASPNNMTFKNGAYLMVDNRASAARTVKIGSTFSINAYGFKIVQLSSATLPATWYVDCDASQNVATILIQK